MLNIEVIKFEAQDVITASGCICNDTCHLENGKHINYVGDGEYKECTADKHNHANAMG